jgi:hypothetical protein
LAAIQMRESIPRSERRHRDLGFDGSSASSAGAIASLSRRS